MVGEGGDSLAAPPALAHTGVHSQGTVRVMGSATGSSKLSCSTLQVTFLPSTWLEGVKVKRLMTVTVPGRGPGSWLVFAILSRGGDQEMRAGGRPPLEMQWATGTGSRLSWLSGISWVSALFWGWAGGKKQKGRVTPHLQSFNKHLSSRGGRLIEGTGCGQVQIPALPLSSRVALGKSVPQFPCLSTGYNERITSDENLQVKLLKWYLACNKCSMYVIIIGN